MEIDLALQTETNRRTAAFKPALPIGRLKTSRELRLRLNTVAGQQFAVLQRDGGDLKGALPNIRVERGGISPRRVERS
jgi:hypothetical protein